MPRCRYYGLALLGLILMAQMGRSEGYPQTKASGTPSGQSARTTATEDQTCVIYSLEDLGDDPEFGRWIADTITEVIAPGSWTQPGMIGPGNQNQPSTSGRKHVLSYYGRKRILVVYHTPAVQAQVDAFLKNMKQALPGGKEGSVTVGKNSARDPRVVPARYAVPAAVNGPQPVPEQPFTYPVPPPARPPKHLFHFIIRYEGEGIIDSNVVEFMKVQNDSKGSAAPATDKKEKEESEPPSASGAAVQRAKDPKKERPDEQP